MGDFMAVFIISALLIAAVLYGVTFITTSITFSWVFVGIASAVIAVIWWWWQQD
jgi:hypothetical protein